jgi:hypothetical protein
VHSAHQSGEREARGFGVRSRCPFSFHLFHFWFLLCPRVLEAAFPLGIRGGSGTGGYAHSSAGDGLCAALALRMSVGGYNVCADTSACRPLFARSRCRCSGSETYPFSPRGAQVVVRTCTYCLMSAWGEAGQGVGGYNWGAALAFRASSVVSPADCRYVHGQRWRGASVSGAGGVHAGGAEKGALECAVECGSVYSRRNGSASRRRMRGAIGREFRLALLQSLSLVISPFFGGWLFCVHKYPE